MAIRTRVILRWIVLTGCLAMLATVASLVTTTAGSRVLVQMLLARHLGEMDVLLAGRNTGRMKRLSSVAGARVTGARLGTWGRIATGHDTSMLGHYRVIRVGWETNSLCGAGLDVRFARSSGSCGRR